jgi:hypothetical protein
VAVGVHPSAGCRQGLGGGFDLIGAPAVATVSETPHRRLISASGFLGAKVDHSYPKEELDTDCSALLAFLMYLLIPTTKGEAVLDSLSGLRLLSNYSPEGLELVAQLLVALLKCSQCFVHASESHALVLEVQLTQNGWAH